MIKEVKKLLNKEELVHMEDLEIFLIYYQEILDKNRVDMENKGQKMFLFP